MSKSVPARVSPDERALGSIRAIGLIDALLGAALIGLVAHMLWTVVLNAEWSLPEARGWELLALSMVFALMAAIVVLLVLLAAQAVMWGVRILVRPTPEAIRKVWGTALTMLIVLAIVAGPDLGGSGSEEARPGSGYAVDLLVTAGLLIVAMVVYGVGANQFIRRVFPGEAAAGRRFEPASKGAWLLACYLLFFGGLGAWTEMMRGAPGSEPPEPQNVMWGFFAFVGMLIGIVVMYKLGARWLCEPREDAQPLTARPEGEAAGRG